MQYALHKRRRLRRPSDAIPVASSLGQGSQPALIPPPAGAAGDPAVELPPLAVREINDLVEVDATERTGRHSARARRISEQPGPKST